MGKLSQIAQAPLKCLSNTSNLFTPGFYCWQYLGLRLWDFLQFVIPAGQSSQRWGEEAIPSLMVGKVCALGLLISGQWIRNKSHKTSSTGVYRAAPLSRQRRVPTGKVPCSLCGSVYSNSFSRDVNMLPGKQEPAQIEVPSCSVQWGKGAAPELPAFCFHLCSLKIGRKGSSSRGWLMALLHKLHFAHI